MPNNRTKLLFVLFLVYCLPNFGQVSMNLLPPPPFGVTPANVLDPVIINGSKGSYRAYLIGSVSDMSGHELVEFRTNFFSVGTGVTKVNYNEIGLIYKNFMDLEFQGSFERTRYFPIGEFNLCATLIQFESEKVLAQTCVPTHVLPLQPPRLVYPIDSAKIKTTDPIFSWLPVTGPGASQSTIRYQITVKQIIDGQSSSEAIYSNPDLLTADNIPNTFYPYPSTSLNNLEYGQQYVWQVKAYSGDYVLGQSEIWIFKPVMDSIRPPKPMDSSFAVPAKVLDGGIHYAIEQLRFKYDGTYTSKQLDFKIYDNNYAEIKGKKARLWQNYGNNKYSIELGKIKGMKPNNNYLLVLTNEKGEQYFLRFRYLKKALAN